MFQKNGIPEQKFWDERFPYGCVDPHQRVMDVRNGILLSVPIHYAFEDFDLTIVKTSLDKYKVLINEFADVEPSILNYNGKEIRFNPQKRNEWPCDDFLQFHNECYEMKKQILEAEAIEKEEETLAERTMSASKVELWLETVLNESS
jgi:hypothetical protein